MFFAKANGKRGEIFIYEDIGEGWFGGITAKSFSDELKRVGDVDELDIYINSPGGSVFDGLAIYNQILRHGAKEKTTHIDGLAASIASIIALSGTKIKMAANASFMIHDPWTFAIGTAEDLRKSAETMDKLRDTLLDTYVSRSGGNRDSISKQMTEETWFSAQEALDAGFITEITESKKIESAFNLVSKFKSPPERLLSEAKSSKVQIARMSKSIQKNRASPVKA